MTLRVSLAIIRGKWDEQVQQMYEPMATAGTAAIDEVEDIVKSESRQDIGAAGFGKRWQNTFRSQRFPRRGVSLNAAAFFWHKIPFAGIFETGGTITGKPLLWVPLEGTPKKIGRNRMTPKNFVNRIGRLYSIKGASHPLLGARVRVSARQAAKDKPKVSLAALKRGSGGSGVLRTIPLFVGIKSADIRDKFHIAEIAERGRNRLPELYLKHLKTDND